jgi:hypothetical protein
VAGAALFVALGGPAEAQRLLSGGDIKPGTITSRQVKDRSIQTKDLSGKARRTLTATPAGSITDAQLSVSAVTSRSLAPGSVLTGAVADATLIADDFAANSVGAEALADNAVGQAEIRNNGVGASEIADRSIDGGEVIDGGLLVRDLARFSGTLEVRIPTAVTKHTCVAAIVTDTPADAADVDITGDLILATAGFAWPKELTYDVKASQAPDADKFFFYVCNPTEADVTPPNPSFFRYAIIGF